MRFGGHQTFFIRDGWLPKALEILLGSHPEVLSDDFASDQLGVGRNMAKSIYHWLLATGLAVRERASEKRLKKELVPTQLAYVIGDSDPYLALPETWYVLHVNLVCNRDHAETWYWFFNSFGLERFDRQLSLRRLERHAKDLSGNPPSQKTLDRDLGCFLNTYATELPAKQKDPEEENWCPFRQLELITFYSQSNNYQLHRRNRPIPASVMMYALESTLQLASIQSSDIRFFELSRLASNPVRVFALPTDGFFEQLLELDRELPDTVFSLTGLAGDRQLRIERREPHEWLLEAYKERVA